MRTLESDSQVTPEERAPLPRGCRLPEDTSNLPKAQMDPIWNLIGYNRSPPKGDRERDFLGDFFGFFVFWSVFGFLGPKWGKMGQTGLEIVNGG